jgi:hypothetical protein
MRLAMQHVPAAMARAAMVGTAALKEQFSFKGSGRIYRARGTKHVKHQASAPGESPAVDLGELRANVACAYVVEGGKHVLKLGVKQESMVERAAALEFGSSKRNIRRRPAFVPIARQLADGIASQSATGVPFPAPVARQGGASGMAGKSLREFRSAEIASRAAKRASRRRRKRA